jgi:hypothetical protein
MRRVADAKPTHRHRVGFVSSTRRLDVGNAAGSRQRRVGDVSASHGVGDASACVHDVLATSTPLHANPTPTRHVAESSAALKYRVVYAS